MELVNFKNVNYKYPTSDEYVLNNLSLTIESGKVYGLIGENGGGKSTLCNLIKGFIPHIFQGQLSGEVTVFGKDMYESDLSDFVENIGFVSQNPFSQITGSTETVFEEIAFGLENLGVREEKIKESVVEVAELFGIDDLLLKNPQRLSGGQKQRVAIASIYVMNPDLFILDEPTSQLDPVGTLEIFSLVSLLKSKGKTVILVENKVELMAKYADELLLIKDGSLIDRGTPEDVLVKESTLDNGSFLPQYTLLTLDLMAKGCEIESLPIKEEDTVEIVNNLIKGGE